MNVLFIGPYLQDDGWGIAARNYVRALKLTGHNIATRPIYLGSSLSKDRDVFKDLEISFDKYDAVIQNVLPSYVEYDSRFGKNIALCYTETGGLEHTGWFEKLDLMDAVIVPSYADTVNLKGIKKPIYTIPIPADTAKFERSYTKLFNSEAFLFYFIGEFVDRKNLLALIQAFHLEFGVGEQANLVIKSNLSGVDPFDLEYMLQTSIGNMKSIMRLHSRVEDYKKEILIVDRYTDEQMCQLHTSCDCFVMPSCGESFNMPAFDAMGFGKTPIVTNRTGMTEFIDESTGYLVESAEVPVLTQTPPAHNLYSAYETWKEIDINHLRKRMREAYNDRHLKSEAGIEKVYEFDYETTANKFNEVLHLI